MKRDDYLIIIHRGESDESLYTAEKIYQALAAATFFLMQGKPGWWASVRQHGKIIWQAIR